jgi:prepilin-type N-terminal cleavage/methylation domain-containing protein
VTGNRAGFTLIELVVAIALFALVSVNVTVVVRMSSRTQAENMGASVLDDQAQRAMDQIAFAIMGASRDKLFPADETPSETSRLRYEVNLGVEDGEVVWSDPQLIELSGDTTLAWRERPEADDERRVVWCNVVRPFLEGEAINGIDDNSNGLIDERGLSFVLEGDTVTIRLTLERQGPDGEPMTRTLTSIVTCRN